MIQDQEHFTRTFLEYHGCTSLPQSTIRHEGPLYAPRRPLLWVVENYIPTERFKAKAGDRPQVIRIDNPVFIDGTRNKIRYCGPQTDFKVYDNGEVECVRTSIKRGLKPRGFNNIGNFYVANEKMDLLFPPFARYQREGTS